MKDGKCSKTFPKEAALHTTLEDDTYPTYRRRSINNFNKKDSRGNNWDVDDSYVVPYNPYLTCKYNAHINVEMCGSIACVKYLYKYVYKGSDTVSVSVVPVDGIQDEILNYIKGRYVGPSEALWRLNCRPLEGRFPAVVRLPVHLPHQQTVTYFAGNEVDAIAQEQDSMLMGYFTVVHMESISALTNDERGCELNGTLYKTAPQLSYLQIPSYYIWNLSQRQWSRRKKPHRSDCVARLYTVSPSAGEKFYLRMLLTTVTGAESFEALRTVNGILYPLFKDACFALHLIADDNEWQHCLREAVHDQLPKQLRSLFVTILVFNNPRNAEDLWNLEITPERRFKYYAAEDFLHSRRIRTNIAALMIGESDYDAALYSIMDALLLQSTRSLHEYGLPVPSAPRELQVAPDLNLALATELDYDAANELRKYTDNYALFNDDQKSVFDSIYAHIAHNKTGGIFLDAPGGTGKTFLFNTLLSKIRSNGEIIIAVSSSGISAMLLAGGRTTHSRFSIPIVCLNDSSSSINLCSNVGKMCFRACAIIWDESPLQHKYIINFVDKLFRKLMRLEFKDGISCELLPFGGKPFVFGGVRNLPYINTTICNPATVTLPL